MLPAVITHHAITRAQGPSCSTRPRLQCDHHHVNVEQWAAADLLSSHRIMVFDEYGT